MCLANVRLLLPVYQLLEINKNLFILEERSESHLLCYYLYYSMYRIFHTIYNSVPEVYCPIVQINSINPTEIKHPTFFICFLDIYPKVSVIRIKLKTTWVKNAFHNSLAITWMRCWWVRRNIQPSLRIEFDSGRCKKVAFQIKFQDYF